MLHIDRNLYVILLLIFYVPAIYRSAILISIDNGPLGIFEWIRSKIEERTDWLYMLTSEDDRTNNTPLYKKFKRWENLNEGINCTDCTGVWAAIILGIILIASFYWDYASIIIFIIGGAGFQHYITNRDNGEDELIV